MRPPASIAAWLDPDELERWVHDAPSKESYRRRLAIWWTMRGRHAGEIAELLLTSARTVRYWIQRFNDAGPSALDSDNLGGRRAALLSLAQERALLAALHPQAREGQWVTAEELRQAIEAQVGAPVSTAYLYDLLHRHQWRKVMPRPRHVRADPDVQEAFKKF
jgi:transposase